MCFPTAPFESPGQQSDLAAGSEPLCGASCSSAPRNPSAQSSEGSAAAPAPTERSEPEGMEDAFGDCRRAEPMGEEGEESKSQPARGNPDSDDSDDDPILIPPTRFRGQGQR